MKYLRRMLRIKDAKEHRRVEAFASKFTTTRKVQNHNYWQGLYAQSVGVARVR